MSCATHKYNQCELYGSVYLNVKYSLKYDKVEALNNNISIGYLRMNAIYEVSLTESMNIKVFWDLTPYSLVQITQVSLKVARNPSTLAMEAVNSCEKSTRLHDVTPVVFVILFICVLCVTECPDMLLKLVTVMWTCLQHI